MEICKWLGSCSHHYINFLSISISFFPQWPKCTALLFFFFYSIHLELWQDPVPPILSSRDLREDQQASFALWQQSPWRFKNIKTSRQNLEEQEEIRFWFASGEKTQAQWKRYFIFQVRTPKNKWKLCYFLSWTQISSQILGSQFCWLYSKAS